ncbi:T7SS effector LXG polymorphic toxin [Bacillus vallismortis]|uniref:T7SS effector LXG polymorphic toxin n=1 Tax=Bacillus vallismortis TaxID=72361 RepID=UPI0039903AEF
MKTLDVHALHEGIQHTIEKLDKQKQQLEKLEKSVEHLAGMKDALKGKGGDAIRTFYEECHKPFLLFFGMFIDEYKKVLKQTQHAISSVESDSHGIIAEAFLSQDARHGVKHAREVTEQLTDAVNRQTSTIGHIISLPTVNDSFFQMETEQAERIITDTLHKLIRFEGQQTYVLETAKTDFQTMKKYIDQLEAMYTGPEIGITGYKSGSILKSQEEENINQTFGAINPQMKQAVDSPMEMMLKKLDEKEKSKVDSVVKTGHSKKVNENIIVINGKVYNTSEHVEHVKTDFSNAEVKQVVYNDTLYNVYISGNNMKLEPVVSLSDIKVDESGYVKILETAVDLTGVNDLFKAVTGRDPITGEKVTGNDRIVASINSVPFAKIAKLEKLRDINKLIDDGKKAKKASKVHKGAGESSKKASGSKFDDVIKNGEKMPKHSEVKNKNSLPGKGEPNSSTDLLNSDGTVKQRRYYDEKGRAKEDIDFNHSDDGTHTFPHRHKWDWTQKKPRQKPE